jgi:hypothetical protein
LYCFLYHAMLITLCSLSYQLFSLNWNEHCLPHFWGEQKLKICMYKKIKLMTQCLVLTTHTRYSVRTAIRNWNCLSKYMMFSFMIKPGALFIYWSSLFGVFLVGYELVWCYKEIWVLFPSHFKFISFQCPHCFFFSLLTRRCAEWVKERTPLQK